MAREVVGEEIFHHVEKMNQREFSAVHFKNERLDFAPFEGDIGNGFKRVAAWVKSSDTVGSVGQFIFIVNGGLVDAVMGCLFHVIFLFFQY